MNSTTLLELWNQSLTQDKAAHALFLIATSEKDEYAGYTAIFAAIEGYEQALISAKSARVLCGTHQGNLKKVNLLIKTISANIRMIKKVANGNASKQIEGNP